MCVVIVVDVGMTRSTCLRRDAESTSGIWVVLVINVNISLVGLIFLSSIF